MGRSGRGGGAWLVFFLALGGFAAWLALSGPRFAPESQPVAATLAGQTLPQGDPEATLDAARRVARAWLGQNIAIVVGDSRLVRSREQLGVRIDWTHLRSLVGALRDGHSALARAHAGTATAHAQTTAPLALSVPYSVDGSVAMTQLLQLKDELDRAAVDARYDFKTKNVSPDEPGLRIDAWGTLARLDLALQRGDTVVAAIVQTAAARRTASQLAGTSTDSVLGWFETKYARDPKHEARTYNLHLAASKLDGFVLMPGETFDFNQVVGARDEANGYRVAPVIAQGELVDGMGGGTCQIAGTLHAAAFFAGLDVPERRPHTRPSFYIKMGLDAAVAYPVVTLKLGNPYAFPVILHETVQGGMVRAEVLGPGRTRDVMFERRIDDILPFADKEIPDPSLPKGARELKQRGIPGFKITRWRVLRDGPFAVRERHQDYYPSTTQIWKVGKGPDDPKFEAHDDEHPEYVTDEFLTLTQGLDGAQKLVESRVPGRTGAYGWTVREGFAKETHGTRARGARDADSREGID